MIEGVGQPDWAAKVVHDEGEALEWNLPRARARPLPDQDVDLVVLERRVENLLDHRRHPVDLVDEQDLTVRQVRDDPDQVAVHLVSLAEETPVRETLETTRLLEERVRMNVDCVHVNMLYPPFAEDPAVNAALDRLKTPRGVRPRTKGAPPLSEQRAKALFACGAFYRDRRAVQQEQRQRLIEGLGGTASVIDLPFLFGEGFAGKELDLLADAIEDTMSQS